MDEKARELKKRWKATEKNAARAGFPLSDDKLEAMFDSVELAVEAAGCDHSLKATTTWLKTSGLESEAVISWLQDNGGFCDCEVVANAREHWEQNR